MCNSAKVFHNLSYWYHSSHWHMSAFANNISVCPPINRHTNDVNEPSFCHKLTLKVKLWVGRVGGQEMWPRRTCFRLVPFLQVLSQFCLGLGLQQFLSLFLSGLLACLTCDDLVQLPTKSTSTDKREPREREKLAETLKSIQSRKERFRAKFSQKSILELALFIIGII